MNVEMGLICRLFKLDLIGKQRQGLYVKYNLTTQGEQLVSKSD